MWASHRLVSFLFLLLPSPFFHFFQVLFLSEISITNPSIFLKLFEEYSIEFEDFMWGYCKKWFRRGIWLISTREWRIRTLGEIIHIIEVGNGSNSVNAWFRIVNCIYIIGNGWFLDYTYVYICLYWFHLWLILDALMEIIWFKWCLGGFICWEWIARCWVVKPMRIEVKLYRIEAGNRASEQVWSNRTEPRSNWSCSVTQK